MVNHMETAKENSSVKRHTTGLAWPVCSYGLLQKNQNKAEHSLHTRRSFTDTLNEPLNEQAQLGYIIPKTNRGKQRLNKGQDQLAVQDKTTNNHPHCTLQWTLIMLQMTYYDRNGKNFMPKSSLGEILKDCILISGYWCFVKNKNKKLPWAIWSKHKINVNSAWGLHFCYQY